MFYYYKRMFIHSLFACVIIIMLSLSTLAAQSRACGKSCDAESMSTAGTADVQALIDEGNDIEATDESFGNAPLHLAIDRGKAGASNPLSRRGKVKRKARKKERRKSDTDKKSTAKKSIVRGKLYDEEFMRGASVSDVEVLIAKGDDVNALGKYGFTPLHFAAGFGKAEIFALLLERGADIEAHNEIGRTPLHYAVISGEAKLVSLLLSKGANAKAKTDDGKTALDVFEKMMDSTKGTELYNKYRNFKDSEAYRELRKRTLE